MLDLNHSDILQLCFIFAGKFRNIPEMIPEFVVPDLTDFKVSMTNQKIQGWSSFNSLAIGILKMR